TTRPKTVQRPRRRGVRNPPPAKGSVDRPPTAPPPHRTYRDRKTPSGRTKSCRYNRSGGRTTWPEDPRSGSPSESGARIPAAPRARWRATQQRSRTGSSGSWGIVFYFGGRNKGAGGRDKQSENREDEGDDARRGRAPPERGVGLQKANEEGGGNRAAEISHPA